MTTATQPTTTAAARINAAATHALSLPGHLRGSVLADVFGSLAGLVDAINRGTEASPNRLADLLDESLSVVIGRSLREGDAVSLEVNDAGSTLVGTVRAIHDSVYTGTTLDIELPGGRIFTQSARFVKPVAR